jgi:hypothetical protein
VVAGGLVGGRDDAHECPVVVAFALVALAGGEPVPGSPGAGAGRR